MDDREFMRKLVLRDICTNKYAAEQYVLSHPKPVYTEEDFEQAYHWEEYDAHERHPNRNPVKKLMRTDGVNMADPAYQSDYMCQTSTTRSDRWR